MTGNLITIGGSGLAAARAGLDVTSQNIANAATAGYVRQSITQTDLTADDALGGQAAQSGVLVTGIARNADAAMQADVRRTASDAARADALVTGLNGVESAVEQSGAYPAITQFQASLGTLASDPTSPALRAATLGAAQAMTQSFNLASDSLNAAIAGFQSDAAGGVATVNSIAAGLAQINSRIASSGSAVSPDLFSQRDAMLSQLSQMANITTSIAANGTATVQMGGTSGPQLVAGNTATLLASSTAADGTLSFTLGGAAIAVTGGTLAADQRALVAGAGALTSLNSIAAGLIGAGNAAQASGVDANGAPGQPLFSGSSAADIGVALTSGSQLATAAAGQSAGSQDTTNLTALQGSLASAGTASQTNALLLNLSAQTASATTGKTALDAIASGAANQLSTTAGVSLDTEAANLLRYQQAFAASGKVIQIAATLLDQLLQIA